MRGRCRSERRPTHLSIPTFAIFATHLDFFRTHLIVGRASAVKSTDAPSSRLQKRQVDCAPPVESTQLKRPLDGRRLDSVDLTVIAST